MISLTKPIVLIGMPGVGKSTVGRQLALKYACPFVDLDACLTEKTGLSIAELVREKGDSDFIRFEGETVMALSLQPMVVSPGGSLVLYEPAMQYLYQHAIVIYLYDSLRHIRARVGDLSRRGVVGADQYTLRQLFEQRDPLYRRYAHCVIPVPYPFRTQVLVKRVQRFISEAMDA